MTDNPSKIPLRTDSALILLAAGNSQRMGRPKQLLDFGGKPLLRHAAETGLASGCEPVVVVLGARHEELSAALDGLPVQITINPDWEEGMGASIQAGLQALAGATIDGAILALADQPLVTAEYYAGLVARHRATGQPIVASRYSGTVGVPVFFSRESFPLLLALGPNQGCKGVILDHTADTDLIDCPDAAVDIDTPEDYARATGVSTR